MRKRLARMALAGGCGVAAVVFAGLALGEKLQGEAANAFFHERWGITLQAPADQPLVLTTTDEVYAGQATSGGRGGVVLAQEGGHPCQYFMIFDQPARSFAFNRSHLIAGPHGITHPTWRAIAYDASNQKLGQVGEDEIRSYTDVPARRFELDGPGIKSITFWGDDKGFDAFCNVLIDTIDETL